MYTNYKEKSRLLLFFSLLIAFLWGDSLTAQVVGKHSFAENSKLASGKWVKVRIAQTGVYRITYEEMVKMGFSNPVAVHVYGFGGAQMYESFQRERFDDLPLIHAYRAEGSHLLFYAQGVVSWEYSSKEKEFEHTISPYSNYGYYFLSDRPIDASASPEELLVAQPATIDIDYFNDRSLHKRELINLGKTGRTFYGESFQTQTTYNFPFSLPGLIANSAKLTTVFISNNGGTVTLSVNGTQVNQGAVRKDSGSDGYRYAYDIKLAGSYANSEEPNQVVTVKYGISNEKSARLDYIRLNYLRKLKPYGSFTYFRSVDATGKVTKYRIETPASTDRYIVWNLSNPTQPRSMPLTKEEDGLTFIASDQTHTEYVLIDKQGSFESVELVGEVGNQNLHALPFADFLIVAHPSFLKQANQLADEHRAREGLRVHVVNSDQIYNEFGSGAPDATAIRWFVKMFYDRAMRLSDPAKRKAERPKNLLLFGDGSFDNRLIGSIWNSITPNNFLPTYQSEYSLSETESYVTDDYYGLLDDNEGINIVSEGIDIGIGRFPVKTAFEAQTAVDKTINYMNNTVLSNWKNNLVFLADDGDSNLHMRQSNELCTTIDNRHKEFVVKKIFIDAFQKEFSGAQQSAPDAKKKLFDVLNSGVLMLNFIGHGSTNGWTGEGVMKKTDIESLYLSKVPLWVTATCDFSRFDDYYNSGGEMAFLQSGGGAIGLYTTTRVVYSGPNQNINRQFIQHIFDKDENGLRYTLGDIFRITKAALAANSVTADKNNLNFILLGNPALRLSYPDHKMLVTKVNEVAVDPSRLDTFRAYRKITIEGVVNRPDGSLATDFDGIIIPTVYDSEEEISCLGQTDPNNIFKFKDRSKILFVGRDSVRQGLFRFQFVVPKNINYSMDPGRINLYAFSSNHKEGQGYFDAFRVGGSETDVETDKEGPTIEQIYLNDIFFVLDPLVNESPMFVAQVSDKSGINVSASGIGQDIQLMIDGDPLKIYSLNEFYQSVPGDFTTGWIRFKIPILSDGTHKLRFKVFDVHNNSTTSELPFIVKSGLRPKIGVVRVDRNPISLSSGSTQFYVTHNRSGANVKLRLEIFDTQGRLAWTTQTTTFSETDLSTSLSWNFMSLNGGRVSPGIYFYRVYVSTDGLQESVESSKLVIIH